MKYINDNINDSDPDIDEDMKLTRKDYITILHHYQSSSRNGRGRGRVRRTSKLSTKTLKSNAHKILGDKFCECIMPKGRRVVKDTTADEGRRVAYCTRSIFNNRALKRHAFRCRGTRKLVGDIVKTENVVRI
jgi:hypothetical protein